MKGETIAADLRVGNRKSLVLASTHSAADNVLTGVKRAYEKGMMPQKRNKTELKS
jgi:hypothetical protein